VLESTAGHHLKVNSVICFVIIICNTGEFKEPISHAANMPVAFPMHN